MPHPRVDVRAAAWSEPEDRAALLALRITVFVHEQGVPEDMEVDEEDPSAAHYLAFDRATGESLGAARLTTAGQVTRMCVSKGARGQGIGAALLEHALEDARARGMTHVHLHAQTHAAGFYARFGFAPVGEEFMEAGIPHQEMARAL